jgi:hypothetical protein
MKKRILFFMSLFLAGMVSCLEQYENEMNDPTEDNPSEWKIGLGLGSTTRALIGDADNGKRPVTWELYDEITVFNNTVSATFSLDEGVGTSTGLFKTVSSDFENQVNYYAVYAPRDSVSFTSGTGLAVNFGSNFLMDGTADEFVSDNMIMSSPAFQFTDNQATAATISVSTSVLELPLTLSSGEPLNINAIKLIAPVADYFVTQAVFDGAGNVSYTEKSSSITLNIYPTIVLSDSDTTVVKFVLWTNPAITEASLAGQEMVFEFYEVQDVVCEIRKPAILFEAGNYYSVNEFPCEGIEDIEVVPLANCYMIAPGDTVIFSTLQANADGTTRISPADVLTVEYLWGDQPGALKTESGATDALIDALSLVELENGPGISVTAGSLTGNAVIAVKKNDVICWSWHIWVTDYAPSGVQPGQADGNYNVPGGIIQKYTNVDGAVTNVFMDRNIGATTAAAGLNTSKGLQYQWGRKDPFRSHWQDFENNTEEPPVYDKAGTPITTFETVKTTDAGMAAGAGFNNVEYTVQNPDVFITAGNNINKGDWYSQTNEVADDALWKPAGGGKSPYDPCPAGWRVPSNLNSGDVSNNASGAFGGLGATGADFTATYTVNADTTTVSHKTLGVVFVLSPQRRNTGVFLTTRILNLWTNGQPYNPTNSANGSITQVATDGFYANSGTGQRRACALHVRCVKDD